ncbi:MAG: hypothetical protein HN657_00635 [Candidatus Marinimicrobia bacterium]|jgi:hypothetical protein|nr:hypothetical protein [Candidatus Neomarinimicrobiota bacterium]MBT3692169.1 hypothetical protein [Candidatus Neomarinimicrobiota bacterium]MBT3732648.1 hypothetical protein [Candidatus Neomarinimicrobiota bacterium]MBT4177462.1 hypothetical protein [Candidatus Neomarinimicrobiota bacterium]MBT4991058.1 hypothetical protein [Candidatus Neomarinimicrobiota bacterium]
MMKKSIFIFCLLAGWAFAQNDIIILSPKVGSVIDAEENQFYEIFPKIKQFVSAQIFMNEDAHYEARIVHFKKRKRITITQSITMKSFVALQNYVNQQPLFSDENRKKKGIDVFYLRAPKILDEMEKPQYVQMQIANHPKIKGTLMAYRNDSIYVQTHIQMEKFSNTELESISYRLSRREYLSLKPIIRTVTAIIGLGLSEFMNEQRHPEIDLKWHNRFLGLVAGMLVSGEIYDALATLIIPTETFALRETENKKN